MTYRACFRILTPSVCTLLIVAVGFAQTPAQKPTTNKAGSVPGTVRVSTRIVQVNVVAQDKDGKPVSGLTIDDFRIFDKGKPQRIASFSEQSNRVVADTAGNANSGPRAAPAANSFSNRNVATAPNVTVLLLDSLNTDPSDMVYVRTQALNFLGQIQPQDRVAVYALTTKLWVLHDFTSDTESLLRVLGNLPKERGGQDASTLSQTAMLAEFFDVGGGMQMGGTAQAMVQAMRADATDVSDKVERTVLALKAIAGHVSGVPGRKNLVWVSGSFPLKMNYGVDMGLVGVERPNFGPQAMDAIQALSDANVAIYPVDARGLLAPSPGYMHRPSSRPAEKADTFQFLAQGTGGVAYYNTNDIAGAIRRAIDDSRVTYALAYYPTHDEWNGAFRDIKVEVVRPGIHLRYRSGYFASPNGAGDAHQQGQVLAAAIKSPFDFTELGLDVKVDAGEVSGARQLKAQVRLAPADLRFNQTGTQWKDDIEIVWVEIDGNGAEIGRSGRTLNIHIPQEAYQNAYEKMNRDGLIFSETIGLPNEAAEVRLILRDMNTGAIGSVNIPLTRLFTQVKAQ